MPTLPDPTTLLNGLRYATGAYAAAATILTTACIALNIVTRLDRIALRRGLTRLRRDQSPARPLFLPLEQASAAAR